MPETTPLIKAALNLRVGAGFDVYKETINEALGYCIEHHIMENFFRKNRD